MTKTFSFYLFCGLIVGTLLPFSGHAQTAFNFGRVNKDTLPERFHIHTQELRNHIYDNIPADLRNDEFPRSTFRFADQASIQLSYLFSSGGVYSDWPSFETYLDQILQKVMPEELKGDSLIQIYLVKQGNFNAYVTPSGMIFLNIGMFDRIENEATLAGIICHELAHHYLHHSIEEYVKRERGDFKPGFLLSNKGAYSNFSIQQELDADALAARWLAQGGYDLQGLISGFEIMERLEKNYLSRRKKMWKVVEYTHPRSEKRLEQLRAYVSETGNQGNQFFQVSEADFNHFRNEAKAEVLQMLLHNFNYDLCIEKAFQFHLFEPGNPTYLYYLMEGIRRYCYFYNDLWRENFIVYRYYDEVKTNNKQFKQKVKGNIFDYPPTTFLGVSEETADKIDAKFYWEDDLKFKTYEQAYVFFNKIAKLVDEPECILSNALSLSFKKEECDKLLRQYLSYKNIRFRDYAENLLNNSIESSLPEETLSVFSEFFVTIRQGNEEIMVREEMTDQKPYLQETLAPIIQEFEGRRYLYLPELQQHRLSDYQIFKELEYISFKTFYAKGDETKIHIIDPRYWEMMHRYGVNEVEFINCSYYDSRKSDISLEGYQSAIETKYQDLLAEVKRHRYFDSYISSIREVENGVSKIKFSGDEHKLNYKSPAKEQVIELLNYKLKQKDEKTAKLDEIYQHTNREKKKKK